MGDTIDNIKGVPGHRREGRARADRARTASLDNLLAHAAEVQEQALSRRAARQHGRGAAEPRAGAHPHRRAGRVRRRGSCAIAPARARLLRDLQRARLPRARQGVRADRRHHRQDLPHRQHRRRACARWPSGCAPPAGSRSACCRTARPRCARRSSASRSRPRRATATTCRSATARSTTPTACRSTIALEALRPLLEDEAIEKDGHDLKFDAIVLARHGVTLRGLDARHDAGELPARRDALGAPARGPRARAHQLQGADRRKTSAAAAPRRSRSPTCRSRRRSSTPASAPIWSASWRRRCAICSRRNSSTERLRARSSCRWCRC